MATFGDGVGGVEWWVRHRPRPRPRILTIPSLRDGDFEDEDEDEDDQIASAKSKRATMSSFIQLPLKKWRSDQILLAENLCSVLLGAFCLSGTLGFNETGTGVYSDRAVSGDRAYCDPRGSSLAGIEPGSGESPGGLLPE